MQHSWRQGALTVATGNGHVFQVAGVHLQSGMKLRLKGVVGEVGLMRGEWVFVRENHGMHGDPLTEHLGETAAVPS